MFIINSSADYFLINGIEKPLTSLVFHSKVTSTVQTQKLICVLLSNIKHLTSVLIQIFFIKIFYLSYS